MSQPRFGEKQLVLLGVEKPIRAERLAFVAGVQTKLRQSLLSGSIPGRLGRVRRFESRGQLRVGNTFSFCTPNGN